MTSAGSGDLVAPALRAEQAFVRSLGGFVLGIAGAELVTHERIPLPAFNYIAVTAVAPDRRTAFFERALDHYFQRALRPTFRIPTPVPAHLDQSLRALGFRPRPASLTLLLAGPSIDAAPGFEVRPASPVEFARFLPLWAASSEEAPLRAALETVWHHPNPDERLTPMVAVRDSVVASGGILYEHLGHAGLHFVTTVPEERGRGAASALVAGVFRGGDGNAKGARFLLADSARLEARLVRLGFRPARAYVVYELPPEAELALPPTGRPEPPRWRPPRGRGTSARPG